MNCLSHEWELFACRIYAVGHFAGYSIKTIIAAEVDISFRYDDTVRFEPRREKTYANNKGADQLAHPRSLISAFVIRCVDSIIPLVYIPKNSRLKLVSGAEQVGLSLTWSETPKTGFLVTRLIYEYINIVNQRPDRQAV